MSTLYVGCVLILIIFTVISSTLTHDAYVVPPVRIQALWPRGVRVSIPDVPGITLFGFNGNINREIGAGVEFGQIKAEVKAPVGSRWTFVDQTVQLKVGDFIYYYVLVETGLVEGSIFVSGHLTGTLIYKIEHLEDISKPISSTEDCKPTLTEVHQGKDLICSGQLLLEDRFSTIRENVWQVEHYIPADNPEYPFLSYQRSAVHLKDSYLNIEAKVQHNEPGFTNATIYCGSLNLSDGCTKPQCSKAASGPDIVPPVVSGRLVSKLAFKYGIVHVRAKLPIGDWLYPEIMLEPVAKNDGSMNYASGVLKIAAARGNQNLLAGSKDYGNKVLYAGPIMSTECREQLLQQNVNDKLWGDEFHIYSVRWTPDFIALSVDGKEWGYVEPGKGTLRGRFPEKCNVSANGTKMAPFDDFFHITLGLSVGGISEFHDDVKTKNDWPKPWKNSSRKAMLNFWRDLASWYPTWQQPRMLVDFVRVIAL